MGDDSRGSTTAGDIAAAKKNAEVEEEEEEGAFERPPVAELRRTPKDPRSKAGWNIFSRLLLM